MNFKNVSVKLLAVVMTVAMMLGVCAPTVIAAVPHDHGSNELHYVSIGDSMTNGYGFDGYNQGNKDDLNGNGNYADEYDFYGDVNVYGEGSYALQFEDYLTGKGYDVTHTKLASSALRAEDLLFLLGGREKPTDGWFDQVLYYTDAGENGKWDDAGDRTPEAIEKLSNHFTNAVIDADLMTLCIGNASFGAYLLSRVSTVLMGGTLDGDEQVDLEDALAILESEEAKALVLEAYAEFEKELQAYMSVVEGFEAEQLQAALNVFVYTLASFLVNYEALIDRIMELNPDVEIILIGLMNTTYGMTVTGEDFEPFQFGDVMDKMFGMLNAYIAGLPAVKQYAGEFDSEDTFYYNKETGEVKDELSIMEGIANSFIPYEDWKPWQKITATKAPVFYYAEQPNPEFIVQAFDELHAEGWNNIDCGDKNCDDCTDGDPATTCENGRLSGPIVRSRQIDAYNGELRGMIGYALGFELPSVDPIKLKDYEAQVELYKEDMLDGDSYLVTVKFFEQIGKFQSEFGEDYVVKYIIKSVGGDPDLLTDENKALWTPLIPVGMSEMEMFIYMCCGQDMSKATAAGEKSQAEWTALAAKQYVADNKLDLVERALKYYGWDPNQLVNVGSVFNSKELFGPDIDAEISMAIYLAIEAAIASCVDTMEITVDGLMGIAGGNVFEMLGPMPPELTGAPGPLTIKDALYGWFTGSETGRAMVKVYALFKVGDGMSVHPTPAAHDNLYNAIVEAYENEHTADKETLENLKVLLGVLYEYHDEAYTVAYGKAVEEGVIDEINAYLDEADAAINNAEATLNNSGYIRSDEFTAEATAAFADARATINALRKIVNNPDALDPEHYADMLDLLDTLLVNLEDIGDLLGIAVVDFGHYVDPMIVELNEQAKAQIEALRAAVEAEIAELRAAVEAEIAALRAAAEAKIAELRAEAEAKIAALRAEAEAKLADLKAQLETAVGEAKAAIEAEIARIEAELAAAIAKVEAELAAAIAKVEAELEAAIAALEAEIAAQIAKLEADLEAAIEAVKARTEEEIIKLQAAVEALIADIDALNRAVKAAIEGTTNAVNGIIADANKYLKENLPEAYDKLVALVLAQIPEADKYLYDWFYNNPEVVIGFFAEHGDDMAAFLVDNADVIGAILGFIAYNYGEDVLNYVVENGDVLLRDFVAWYKIYGDRVWDILGVYLDALGVNTDIFELDGIYSALNDLAALVAQLGSDFADDAWNKLVESGILEDILSSVESIKAEAYAKLAYLENELRAQLQLQLDALNAELAALNAQLEAAIAAGNAALAAQLKAAIAELEAAIAQVKAELAKIDAMINEVKAVVEKLIADVERIEAIVNKIIDLVENNVDFDAVLPVIKEALKDLNEALRDAIDTAALVDQLEAALKVLLAEGVDALVDYLKAIGTDAANEAAAALEAIAKAALKQLANVIETELVALGAKINEALNTFVKEALTNGYLYLEEYLKENLPEAYDKFVEFILSQIPGASKYVYNWICNNPDVVIGFFAEYGDEMIDFLKDNADTILAVVAYIAEKYGDDVLDYVLNNADVLLPAFVSWYEAYGDKVWTVLDTYLNALGVNTDIFDLDSIYAALNNLAALIAQLGNDFADDAWNKLIESGILEDILESIENVKAEAYAKLAYLENELRAQIQLQLDVLNAELAALNAKLEAAIAAGNAALAAQLKAAIAELEAAIAQVEAELAKIDAMINEVKAAVEELIAAVERIEAIVNKIVDVIESNANLDAILPVIKEALKDLNSALIDAINAAALVEKLETALKILVAEGVDACVNYLKAVGTEVANEVAAALEAIAKAALKQLADAIEAELAVLGAKLNAALKIFIEGALTSDYIRTEDSYYLAIGSDPDYFAQLLAEKLNLKDSFGAINWNEITPESIAMADLISISYNENELSAFAISQAFGYAADYVNYDLKNDVLAYIDAAFDEFAHNSAASSAIKPEVIAAMKAAVIASVTGAIDQTSADVFGDATKAEMDWAGIVGAENLQYVNKAREEMKNAIANANVPEFYTQKINVIDLFYENLDMLGEYKEVIDMFEPEYIRGCFGEYEEYTVKVPVADALAFAGESYAFSVAQLSKSYAETIMMINKVNPDATVVLLGHYNAFDGVALGDVDLGEVYGAFAKACGILPFGYALLADNVVFVDISEAETVFGAYAEGGEFTALDFFMFYALDPTITSVSEAGHAYIAEKIFAALNITCEHVDNNNDHNCDLCDAVLSECADEDKDHKCDVCDAVLSDCADADKDHNCDYCGAELGECADTDKDHKCDYCGETLSECADADNDHNCDYCGATLSECADTDKDHKCDICGETLSECVDTDNDKKCDYCGEAFGECEDKDNDHYCDYCGEKISECLDLDIDHYCDICGATLSDCADADKDHNCDYCGAELGECADADKDHKCDYCGATLSECADADKDHKCDYCGAVLSKCADTDNNHKCDYCDAVLSKCGDADKNHKCDICGIILSVCNDADKDHKCDYCGETLSECADADKNHKCDLCGATLSECADANKDHKCDLCGAVLSECADANKDHKCDLCGVELSKCDDANKDHNCDYCGADLSKCDDANKDHKCDLCGAVLSECADADKDHKCDYCGATLSECADANKDHKCDYCGATLGECADADKDHKCDYCGAVLSKCDDADKNHKCDYCGAVLSKCDDADKDHKCDYCGAVLSECADVVKNHKCDYCGATLSECADENNDHKCEYCGNTVSEHKWADATCKAPKTCEICGKTEGKVADHQYGDWETVKEATKKEEGEQKKTCKVCGDTVTEVIPMLEKSSAAPIITAVVIVVVAGLGTAFVVLKKKKIF